MPTSPKPRSCVVCRSRKVRCDKQSPCSNCLRAGIPCVPPARRRPRWAHRLDGPTSTSTDSSTPGSIPGAASNVDSVLERVQNLEDMVRHLSAQLEQASASASEGDGEGAQRYPSVGGYDTPRAEDERSALAASSHSAIPQQFGRLVLKESADRSPYVSSGFWSQVSDELGRLKLDVHALAGENSDSSDDEGVSRGRYATDELERSPSERHAFLFRHNLGTASPDPRKLKPLPSQLPFLLDVFHQNINILGRLVHMPTMTKMIRASRNAEMPTPAHEALLFSICYTAVVSMEEEDVTINFGTSKADLTMQYRLGLEHALAKADFLYNPNIVCVQALALFLWLLRVKDSPKFVWTLTGLTVRLAQFLGLQRDGSHFGQLTPFEIETRRRIWWNLYVLDMRSSEDQGTEPAIATSSFDTKIPSNINDEDIDPDITTEPQERTGLSDLSFARAIMSLGTVMRQIMTVEVKGDPKSLDKLNGLLENIYPTYERNFARHTTEKEDVLHWVGATSTRLVAAKMTLLVFLPVLFAPSDTKLSNDIRNRLLVAAIEVAEYNHALNSEPACRKWSWIFQTYTHWYSIVYIMLEISQRPWSPICERAWIALHSSWLIPSQTLSAKNLRVWIPLRKLMARVHKHRTDEYSRLRADPQAAAMLDSEDQKIPEPATTALFPTESSGALFRKRWYELLTMPPNSEEHTQSSTVAETASAGHTPSESHAFRTSSQPADTVNAFGGSADILDYVSTHEDMNVWQDPNAEMQALPWPWTDSGTLADPFPDLGIDSNYMEIAEDSVDWYGWVASARDMEGGKSQD